MKYILKSFAKDNFFECLLHEKPSKAIILLDGFPSNNNLDEIMYFFYDKGYNVFFMRYKGMFQSKGKFLAQDPSEEIIAFTKYLEQEQTINLWDNSIITFKNTELIIITGSFSGAIALSALSKSNSTKTVLFSPVWDYSLHNKEFEEQELSHLTQFVKKGWNNLYNYDFDDVQKQMLSFDDCLWKNYSKNLMNKKILVLQDNTDKITSIKHTKHFKQIINTIELIQHKKGHGMNLDILKTYSEQIINFID